MKAEQPKKRFNRYAAAMLRFLQVRPNYNGGRVPMHQSGTTNTKALAKRRAKNKIARRSRRINRG